MRMVPMQSHRHTSWRSNHCSAPMSIATARLRALALALAALVPIACDSATIRLPSSANSTLSLVPSTIVADGVEASALSIRILDTVGNPLAARLAATGPVDVDGEAVWASDHAAVVVDLVTPG